MAKEVLQTQDLNFCHRPISVGMRRLSYNGSDIMFAKDFEYFREIRKISALHLFSVKRVQSFAPILQDEFTRLIHKISSLASASKVVDLSELLFLSASSNICRLAFGRSYEEEEEFERRRFHSLFNEFQAMSTAFFIADYFPSIGWLDKLTGKYSRLDKVFNDLDLFYEEIIDEHLDPNRLESDQKDVIDVLLNLMKARNLSFELTLDHIKAILMNIFVAGTDTSTIMVIWAMTELIKNPTIMSKVQEELRNNLSDSKGCITMDNLLKCKYFKAVVKETLRFHPAAPVTFRETLKKSNIEGYDILPKTHIYVSIWALGRDPEHWENPEKFMPERFMESSIDYKGNDFELIPFGAGRKICPGMVLGVASYELALANLLYNFQWELPNSMSKDDIDTDTLPGLVMSKKDPLCLLARKFT
uniref:Cytochrome P450 n=2 Tax=Chenopodium quinoa TaxID=63459 RepID=A0A803LV92_CHEQI